MAIKIIKQGVKEFRATCPRCGCVFIYEREDVHEDAVICPYCEAVLPTRDVTKKVDETPLSMNGGYGTITNPNGTYNPHQVNDLVYRPFPLPDWATKSDNWSGCEGCPNNPKYLKTLYVGDSPCQWCPKSPWKITCTSNVK